MKKIVKIMKPFVEKNNPKTELTYIYYDSVNKRLVATDTIRLLIIEKDLGDEDLYIDVHNKNECIDKIVIEDGFIACKTDKFKYPNVDRIIPQYQNRLLVDNKNFTLVDAVFNTGSLSDINPLIKWSKKYDVLEVESENINIIYDSENMPIMYQCLINVAKAKKYKEFVSCKLIIMPINQQ